MSMLNKLKENAVNPVFMDEDDDDIDNMDFPLPTNNDQRPSSSMPQGMPQGMPNMQDLQKMMQHLSANGGGAGPSSAAPQASPYSTTSRNNVTVATGPNGVQRLDPSEYKDWVCVYPCYIDVDKSVTEGRKIIKEKAVKNPHAYHMAVVVQELGLTVVYEGKRHPRDWANPGRVKVQLKGKNNFFINQQVTTRKQLFYAIAERLPQAQKTHNLPKGMVFPTTSLAEVETLADEQRKAQGLPTLAEMNAQAAAQQQQMKPAAPKKQKVKYVRG